MKEKQIILDLVDLVEEQQALIKDLLDVNPDVQRKMKQISLKMKNLRRNAQLLMR